MHTRIHIIGGPTASGKSARALDIAQAERGVIINADAMQVYRELRILSARPSQQDEECVPHALYGVLPASEACSAALWLKLASAEIERAWKEDKLPVVTGGTGLYIKALMEGLSPIPDVPAAMRAEATRLYAKEGAEALRIRDPALAAQLKPGDTQRHTRALEVWLATSKPLSFWQEQSRVVPFPDATFTLETTNIDREILYQRCDTRFLHMLDAGALQEVKNIAALGLSPSLPAMRAVGVPELMAYLNGDSSYAEAITRAQQATRNYAKRQLTWFRNQLPV